MLVAVTLWAPTLPTEHLRSVGVLTVRIPQGWWTLCTAWAIKVTDQRTLFATAGHCIIPRRTYGLGQSLASQTLILASPVVSSTRADFGLFEILGKFDLTPLPLSKEDPKLGERVTLVGFPGMVGKEMLTGHVSATASAETGGLIHIQMSGIAKGGSGSPLFCGDKVCGILVGLFDSNGVGVVEPVSAWRGEVP